MLLNEHLTSWHASISIDLSLTGRIGGVGARVGLPKDGGATGAGNRGANAGRASARKA